MAGAMIETYSSLLAAVKLSILFYYLGLSTSCIWLLMDLIHQVNWLPAYSYCCLLFSTACHWPLQTPLLPSTVYCKLLCQWLLLTLPYSASIAAYFFLLTAAYSLLLCICYYACIFHSTMLTTSCLC